MADREAQQNSLLFFLLLYFYHPICSETIKRLTPEKLLLNEELHNKESVVYRLTNLEKGDSYELRISYPSTVPTEFLIKLINATDHPNGHNGRKLLNIEKIIFKNGLHQNEQFARVTALRIGEPLELKRLQDPITYNIVLEKLYIGLPWEVWKTGFFVISTIIISIKFILPKVETFFDNENLRMEKRI